MAELPSVFNAANNEKMGSFEPIPAGWYSAEIIRSEMMDTKAKNGNKYLKLRFKILDGDYEGRYVFNNLNLINQNQQAVEIAKKELASICESCEVDEISDSEELHNVPIGIRLTIREANAQWPASNEIKEYCSEADLSGKHASDDSSPFS